MKKRIIFFTIQLVLILTYIQVASANPTMAIRAALIATKNLNKTFTSSGSYVVPASGCKKLLIIATGEPSNTHGGQARKTLISVAGGTTVTISTPVFFDMTGSGGVGGAGLNGGFSGSTGGYSGGDGGGGTDGGDVGEIGGGATFVRILGVDQVVAGGAGGDGYGSPGSGGDACAAGGGYSGGPGLNCGGGVCGGGGGGGGCYCIGGSCDSAPTTSTAGRSVQFICSP